MSFAAYAAGFFDAEGSVIMRRKFNKGKRCGDYLSTEISNISTNKKCI